MLEQNNKSSIFFFSPSSATFGLLYPDELGAEYKSLWSVCISLTLVGIVELLLERSGLWQDVGTIHSGTKCSFGVWCVWAGVCVGWCVCWITWLKSLMWSEARLCNWDSVLHLIIKTQCNIIRNYEHFITYELPYYKGINKKQHLKMNLFLETQKCSIT